MISDVMCDAIGSLDYYLDDPIYETMYDDEIRAKVLAARRLMEEVRAILDASPGADPCPQHRTNSYGHYRN